MIKVAINGFGRIGKCVARIILQSTDIKLVRINSNKLTVESAAYALKYDSIHGIFDGIQHNENGLIYNKNVINISNISSIDDIDWCDIDVVLECTGVFNTKTQAYKHISKGARNVIVSAPCINADYTVVLGVNEIPSSLYQKIISTGSCTTNCLANIVKPLHDNFIIESAFMTTIHSYTNDQCLLDSRHSDFRRSRAAAVSMIPTSTGAAKLIGDIIPELYGKIDGIAIRVPTQNVSMVDLNFLTQKRTTVESINQIMYDTANKLPHIVYYCDEELVSTDFNHTTYSAIFDATQTKSINNKLFRVAAWYDNEWGFASRMVNILKHISDS